jgi:flagellar motor switch protein FliN
MARYERLSLPLVPELGRCTMTVREVLALGPGSLITLPKAVGSKIEVRVGGVLFGCGEFVSAADRLTLRFSSFHSDGTDTNTQKDHTADGA